MRPGVGARRPDGSEAPAADPLGTRRARYNAGIAQGPASLGLGVLIGGARAARGRRAASSVTVDTNAQGSDSATGRAPRNSAALRKPRAEVEPRCCELPVEGSSRGSKSPPRDAASCRVPEVAIANGLGAQTYSPNKARPHVVSVRCVLRGRCQKSRAGRAVDSARLSPWLSDASRARCTAVCAGAEGCGAKLTK